MRREPSVRTVRVHRPRGSVDERDGDQMKALALLVRDEGHAECEEEQKLVLDSIDTRRNPGFRIETGFTQRLGDPLRARARALRHNPPSAEGHARAQPLQEVAAGRDQFGLELPASLRIEREREARRHLEIPLHRFGGLDPYERVAFGHGCAEIRERLDDERPQRRRIAHADTASPESPRTVSFVSFTCSYWARARTSESPRRRSAERRSSAARRAPLAIIRSSNERRSSRLPRIRSSSPTTSSNMWILRSRSSIKFASTVSSAHTFTTWTSRS